MGSIFKTFLTIRILVCSNPKKWCQTKRPLRAAGTELPAESCWTLKVVLAESSRRFAAHDPPQRRHPGASPQSRNRLLNVHICSLLRTRLSLWSHWTGTDLLVKSEGEARLLLIVTNSLTSSKGNTATAWSLDGPKTVTVTGEACTHLLTHEQQQSTHHRRCSLPSQRAFLLHLHVKGVKLCIFLSFFDDKLVLNTRSAEPGPGNAEHSDGTRCPCFSLSWCEVRSHTHFALLSSNDPDSANYRAGPSFIPSGHDRGRLVPGADVEVIVHLFTLNISFTRVQKSIMDMNAPFFCIKVHLDPWSKFNHCDRRFSKEKVWILHVLLGMNSGRANGPG